MQNGDFADDEITGSLLKLLSTEKNKVSNSWLAVLLGRCKNPAYYPKTLMNPTVSECRHFKP